MPPWVRHQFPEAGRLVRRLRDTACLDPACEWCRERHDARKELARWFDFDGFRPEPASADGRPMQQSIVETAMAGEHVLGILPTGTGKSLCYQIPALSRYDKTGALTVVISPLVALMADQVAGLEAHGIGACVAINGLLSMPERADALDRIRLGDAGLVLVSPEQLRNRSFRRALSQREIGAWVLDEAHCLSRWGHDFRPDYRYVGRFIREKAGPDGPIPPVMCLTATAKPDVVDDIGRHFRDELGAELTVFDGGAQRTNLEFVVVHTTGGEKFPHIHQILMADLPPDTPGGAIVYCATRRKTEEVAEFLQMKEVAADYFHAALPPETKKSVLQRFIAGELRVIAATNAFGMGIDKPDVRLVIHADIPGSLENYLQEAGRAGRDRERARCVLLYAADDVERQFGMSARSRLTRREIHGILRALRNLDRKKRLGGEVVATAGEILLEDDEKVFERDSTTDDTRVRTAISWLEEAVLLAREENEVRVFPSSLRVSSVEEARGRLERQRMSAGERRGLLSIAEALIDADPDEGISTDELMNVSGLSPEGVRAALYDLERLGIASNDTALTAFVHAGVDRSSRKRLDEAETLEIALIEHLREAAPDMGKGDTSMLHLRVASQKLRDAGVVDPLPERLWRILRSIAADGRGEGGGAGSLGLRKHDAETVRVTLHRDWPALKETAARRRVGSRRLLEHLIASLPPGSRGTDLLAETTLGNLMDSLMSDLLLKSWVKNPEKLLDRALLWLHEQEVMRLHKGLAVFRPAMTIRLADEKPRRGFAAADFVPLRLHYEGQVRQIHVMVEFARRGLEAIADALHLAMDYFGLKEEEFLRRWLPDRNREIARETTPESWRAIVESLKDPVQQRIVSDDRDQTNVLVLAGPGSGKTRVLVHRIAYLIRARRENPRGILALAYNRHAAVEIRRRLRELVGDDARGVTVLTCHGLAMRLVGASFSERAERPDGEMFGEVMRQAIAHLRGEGLPPEEADEQRERFLAGFRWILVDEYQDLDADQYDLISALAGRTLGEEDHKLTLFAVGDDDQNIYAFNGASVEFIRRFEADFGPRPAFLVDNYRSTGHIIAAANALIEPARNRMKGEHPIRIDRARTKDPPGGTWQERDPVAHGRVQVLPAHRDPISQARVAMTELLRLADLVPGWDWSRCAVIAREWKYLEPVRAFCEVHRIPAQMGNEEIPRFWLLRETRALVEWLRGPRYPAGGRHGPPWLGGRASRRALGRAAAGSPERTCARNRRGRRSAGGPLRRVARRVGARRPPPAAWTDASERAPCQGARVRPRGGARRRLGPSRQGRRSGRPAPALLRGHDPRPADARACAFRWIAGCRTAELRERARTPRLRRALAPAAACLSGRRPGPAPPRRRPAAGIPGTCPPVSTARHGRRLPELRRAPPSPGPGASRRRRPVPRRSARGTGRRTGTPESGRRIRDGRRAPGQELRSSGRNALHVRHRPRRRDVEPRSVGAPLPGRPQMRHLGGGDSRTGIRAGRAGVLKRRPCPRTRLPSRRAALHCAAHAKEAPTEGGVHDRRKAPRRRGRRRGRHRRSRARRLFPLRRAHRPSAGPDALRLRPGGPRPPGLRPRRGR